MWYVYLYSTAVYVQGHGKIRKKNPQQDKISLILALWYCIAVWIGEHWYYCKLVIACANICSSEMFLEGFL